MFTLCQTPQILRFLTDTQVRLTYETKDQNLFKTKTKYGKQNILTVLFLALRDSTGNSTNQITVC